jgi:hypothetical protein
VLVCLRIGIHTWKAARRCWVSHVDTQTNGTHDGHCEDIQPGAFDPLSKSRSAVIRRRTMRRHARLPASEHARLLLTVSASGRGRVCCNRRSAAAEETHCAIVLVECGGRDEVLGAGETCLVLFVH